MIRQLENKDLSSFLYTGVMRDIFRLSGKMPVANDLLKILVRGCLIQGAISRKTFGWNES